MSLIPPTFNIQILPISQLNSSYSTHHHPYSTSTLQSIRSPHHPHLHTFLFLTSNHTTPVYSIHTSQTLIIPTPPHFPLTHPSFPLPSIISPLFYAPLPPPSPSFPISYLSLDHQEPLHVHFTTHFTHINSILYKNGWNLSLLSHP